MFEEIIKEVIQVLIENKGQLTIKRISEETGLESRDISRVVFILNKINIITETETIIKLEKTLKGIQVAKLAQLGVDIYSFNAFFKITKKDKENAIKIASNTNHIKTLEVKKRQPLIQKRNYLNQGSDSESLDMLMLLLEVSNANLYDYIKELSSKDETLNFLLTMHEQSEKSIVNYLESNNEQR